jgi:Reverse transcriptase (RNA-dependent DNA polymerase)
LLPGSNAVRQTTKGWKLLVNWKDGTSDWVPLADLKESYPVQVAEYAVNNKIVAEPAFSLWVPHVLKKRERIIKKVKSRHLRRTHKFGIEIPAMVEQAFEIDRQTRTTLWRDAIEKEFTNVKPAFEIRDDLTVGPPGFKEIQCHLIFDEKAETLKRKAQYVAGGHMTDPPKDAVYSSVVSRDSVRLFFLIAALNDLQIKACDVQNAYINAPTKEKVWFRAGQELGSNAGKVVIIVRALYGLKSSGARFREHMAQTLRDAGFESCKADPDVWLRKAQKADGTKIYEYVLCYVDDILYGGTDPDSFMARLSTVYKLKEGSVKEPDIYLGATIKTMTLRNGEIAYGMSSDAFVKRAVENVEQELAQVGESLKKKVVSPLAAGYRPELDSTPELDE